MKIISEVTVSVLKNDSLSKLVSSFNGKGCLIRKMEVQEEEVPDTYRLEIMFTDPAVFSTCLDEIRSLPEHFHILKISSVLEEALKGGLMDTCSRLPFEKPEDYDVNIMGGAQIINSKIAEGLYSEFSGMENTVACVCAVSGKKDVRERLYPLYTAAERDSVIIKRYTGIKTFPSAFRYDQPEDCIRHLQNGAVGCCCVRISDIQGGTISMYSQIRDDFPVPLIIRETDEIPLYIGALVRKCTDKNKTDISETNVGILGIDNSTIRLTEFLMHAGFRRVLGCDDNDAMLMDFEKAGGLATTRTNILENTDLLIITGQAGDMDAYRNVRPGQFVVSMVPFSAEGRKFFAGHGVREFIQGDPADIPLMMPGLVLALIKNHVMIPDNDVLLKLAGPLAGILTDTGRLHLDPEQCCSVLVRALENYGKEEII